MEEFPGNLLFLFFQMNLSLTFTISQYAENGNEKRQKGSGMESNLTENEGQISIQSEPAP